MRYLLFGGSGILGSGFQEAIARRPGDEVLRISPDWGTPRDAAREAATAVAAALPETSGARVLWAAGIGQVGSSRDSMSAERAVLDAVCETMSALPGPQRRGSGLVMASSAGALFGG